MSNGQVKADGAGQVQPWHNKWSAQGKYFRKPPLTLDLVEEGRSRPVRRESAASPAMRGVQGQLGCGARPRFPQDGPSPVRVPCPQGSLRPRAVAWPPRRGSVGERSAGLGGGEPRDIFECEAEPEHFMNGLI